MVIKQLDLHNNNASLINLIVGLRRDILLNLTNVLRFLRSKK
jgi:hypothetical protein